MKTLKRLFIGTFSIGLLFFTSYCSKDNNDVPDQVSVPGEEPANLRAFFSDLQAWNAYSPLLAEADEPIGEAIDDSENTDIDGTVYSCSTTAYSLTSTPEKIVTLNPDAEILYVGSLLQGKGHLNGIGSLAELPVRQRAPLELTIDLLTSDNNRTVENPTVSTVNQAIGELIGSATNEGYNGGSDISYTNETTHSLTQASLKMGISGNYMGVSAKAELEASLSEEKRTVTAYFVQKMFTVSMVLPQNPEDVFSDEFTQNRLDREIAEGRMGDDNLPVYISSIVYGRIMMYTFTSFSSDEKIKATISAMYSAIDTGVELDTEYQEVLDNAEIKVVTVGGDDDAALSLIYANNLAEYFSSDPPLSSARPISYTIRNLKDNVIAKVSETSEYNLKQCQPIPETGAEYNVVYKNFEVISTDDGGIFNDALELYWELRINDVRGAYRDCDELREGNNDTCQNELRVEPGDFHAFGAAGERETNVALDVSAHYDGRDRIELRGHITDDDYCPYVTTTLCFGYNNADDPAYLNVNIQFGTNNEPPREDGTFTRETLVVDGDTKIKVKYDITRTALLYD